MITVALIVILVILIWYNLNIEFIFYSIPFNSIQDRWKGMAERMARTREWKGMAERMKRNVVRENGRGMLYERMYEECCTTDEKEWPREWKGMLYERMAADLPSP